MSQNRAGLFFCVPDSEEALDQEPQYGDEQGGDVIERLAVLDVEDGQAGGNDEHAADDGQFVDQRPLEKGT